MKSEFINVTPGGWLVEFIGYIVEDTFDGYIIYSVLGLFSWITGFINKLVPVNVNDFGAKKLDRKYEKIASVIGSKTYRVFGGIVEGTL